MCTSPLWRLAVPRAFVKKAHLSGYGYNSTNQSFVLGRHRTRELEDLINYYCVYRHHFKMPEEIPCGICMECRIKRSKEWAQKAVLEASEHEHNWFVTLTYDDEHIFGTMVDTISRHFGERSFCPSLIKEDFVAFKKRFLERLRYKTGASDVKFLQCGEYGSLNGRPHFHVLFFNCFIPDLEVVRKVNLNGRSYCYYTSKMLEESWGKGFITIGEVNWDTCAYVARYVTKKMYADEEKLYQNICDLEGVPPQQAEYISFSNRPGLGKNYYVNHMDDISDVDKVVLPGGRTVQPSAYYDKLFAEAHGEGALEEVKLERQRRSGMRRMSETYGMSWQQAQEYHKSKAAANERRLNKLKRPL